MLGAVFVTHVPYTVTLAAVALAVLSPSPLVAAAGIGALIATRLTISVVPISRRMLIRRFQREFRQPPGPAPVWWPLANFRNWSIAGLVGAGLALVGGALP
jgi:hypothetical protein